MRQSPAKADLSIRPEDTGPPLRRARVAGSAANARDRRSFKAIVSTLLAAVLAGLLLTACGGSSEPGETIRLDIPRNATELVEQGKKVPGVPDRITGTVGDTLVIDNRDSSTQFVAGYSIAPGQTLNIPLNRAGNYRTNCSAHRDKSLEMSISE